MAILEATSPKTLSKHVPVETRRGERIPSGRDACPRKSWVQCALCTACWPLGFETLWRQSRGAFDKDVSGFLNEYQELTHHLGRRLQATTSTLTCFIHRRSTASTSKRLCRWMPGNAGVSKVVTTGAGLASFACPFPNVHQVVIFCFEQCQEQSCSVFSDSSLLLHQGSKVRSGCLVLHGTLQSTG